MAEHVSYLLVSGVEDPDAVAGHRVIDEAGFAEKDREASSDREAGHVRFAVGSALEAQADFTDAAEALSADFPEAVVTLVDLEERFGNIERLRTRIYRNGRPGGEVRHGRKGIR